MFFQSRKANNEMRFYSLTLCALIYLPGYAFAHPELIERLESINTEIKEHGISEERLLQRADVYLQHDELEKSERDYRAALKIDSSSCMAHYGLARLLRTRGKREDALKEISLCTNPAPVRNQMLTLKASLLAEQGHKIEAIRAIDEILADKSDVAPDVYLKRSRLLVETGQVEEALKGIKDALTNLGEVPSLVDEALALEQESGRTEDALQRIEQQILKSPRKDDWYLKKALLLKSLGRIDEAKATASLGVDYCVSLRQDLKDQPAVKQNVSSLKRIMNS